MKIAIKNLRIRSYEDGDAEKIADFLNFCYGGWGDLQKWKYLYKEQPLFMNSDVVIAESKGRIVGHNGIHYRDLKLCGRNVHVALMADAAVLPEFRGRRLNSKLIEECLLRARLRGASLCLLWTMKGSAAYKSVMRAGFVELNCFPAYLKIQNHVNVLRGGLKDFFSKSGKLSNALLSLGYPISFEVDKTVFSIQELLGEASASAPAITVHLKLDAVSHLAEFRAISNVNRAIRLAYLLLTGKIRIRVPSMGAFLELLKKSAVLVRSPWQ